MCADNVYAHNWRKQMAGPAAIMGKGWTSFSASNMHRRRSGGPNIADRHYSKIPSFRIWMCISPQAAGYLKNVAGEKWEFPGIQDNKLSKEVT
jgi:hypothetical protein